MASRSKPTNEKLEHTSSESTLNNETPFFLLSVHDTATKLKTDPEDGLKSSAVAELQARDGPNELGGGGGVSALSILGAQICNAMVLVLIICLAVSLGIQSWIEGGVIAAVIVINVVSTSTSLFASYSCRCHRDERLCQPREVSAELTSFFAPCLQSVGFVQYVQQRYRALET